MTSPLRHLSIRVPWHDQAWNGTVCKAPAANSACLCLKNIAGEKQDAAEEAVKGKSVESLAEEQMPPCVKERATFMAPFAFTRHHRHPYSKTSPDTHAHFAATPMHFPAWSAAALPFRWMQREMVFGKDHERWPVRGLKEDYPLQKVLDSHEPELPFNSSWVQDARNHWELLDCFWSHLQEEESLVFFYAKQVPLVDDPGRRVIVGVGRVKRIGGLTEYDYNDQREPDSIRSLLWERMVTHSIRPDGMDGFLLPYHQAMEKAAQDPSFDPASVVAFAPADRQLEFSYATEHVTPDGALAALLAIAAALESAKQSLEGNFSRQLDWVNEQTTRLWKQRGPCPGLGAVLGAMGIPLGSFVANAVVEKTGTETDPWPLVEKMLASPGSHLPAELAGKIAPVIGKSWQKIPAERRAFLRLLSRFELTLEQAQLLFDSDSRGAAGFPHSDEEILRNPYLLYESTRLLPGPEQVSVQTVDRGIFPKDPLATLVPVPEPSALCSGVDERRLRALAISVLEGHAAMGDTLQTRQAVNSEIRNLKLDPKCDLTSDTMSVAEDEVFGGEINMIRLADKSPGYQLSRLAACGQVIRELVTKRAGAPRHGIQDDWAGLVTTALEAEGKKTVSGDRDQKARDEKAVALEVLCNSRLSVLIGPAGTGKTTLLSALVRQKAVASGGVMLLAPTGKARVRMQEKVGGGNFQAKTIAQFLFRSKRFDGRSQRYRLRDTPAEKTAETIIIDECSMMTEEMLAATFQALSGVKRVILVGDYRQLPPIGAGKPFVDIVNKLRPASIEAHFPRCSPEACYAELTVNMRQGAANRDDARLAAWFTGAELPPGEDEILSLLTGHRKSEHIEIRRWNSVEELHSRLHDALKQELAGGKTLDQRAFDLSLGGKESNGYVYFNTGEAGRQAENWQVLTPVRPHAWGVQELNRLIHLTYRADAIKLARKPNYRMVPKPAGTEQIVYGDKVINNRNHSRSPWPEGGLGVLANGEIGMVVGQFKKYNPSILHVEFSTQPKFNYSFFAGDFSEEGSPDLELAYALTVHRAQGSEFGKVFLVLPKNRRMLTREMLYTALTRQKEKVILLCEGDPLNLREIAGDRFSEMKTRFTNLFSPPDPKLCGESWLDGNLIHQTARGELVRSKSEVIIADHLHRKGIAYRYEEELKLGDDIRIPDFTIEDDDTGIIYYWEHCGMIFDTEYARRWEEKKALYRAHGILPREEGGGPKGTLIVTHDDSEGGISSKEIADLVDEIF